MELCQEDVVVSIAIKWIWNASKTVSDPLHDYLLKTWSHINCKSFALSEQQF